MPRYISHASPLEDGSGDALEGLLTDLSLTDARETGTVEKGSSAFNPFLALLSPAPVTGPIEKNTGGFNPFLPYLVASAGEPNPEQTIEKLTRDVIPQQLAELQKPRRFILNETDDLYLQGRRFQKKWGISEEGFNNWKSLLLGWVEFPAILLLNPSPWDHLPFDEMVDESPTLSWLQKTLKELQLQLEDVIILDTFPMLRDKLRDDTLRQMGPARRDELARESFALTRASLALIQPRVLVSCQCCTRPGNDRWGFFNNDELAEQLCSSGVRARSRQVRELDLSGHKMHVVQGMHPQYVMEREPTQKEVLVELFTQVFRPFGMWQSRRAAMQQQLRDAGAVLLGLVMLLQQQMKLYGQLCAQSGSGVEGPLAAEHVEELRKQLAEWEDGNKLKRKEG
ncbi:hypothetical protein AFCA_012216 [Aspergillus flavus]|uniref:Uncharacterized protein n=1 Tax=Aspergillus flavus TaxID=5059 RepID=A0AB74CIM3_ASPFL|nr:hypothetical protein CA14_008312 [Aspergillus flavus]UDD65021.1 hypothetical protein AFCA_012216 [Aspergillus flavus]